MPGDHGEDNICKIDLALFTHCGVSVITGVGNPSLSRKTVNVPVHSQPPASHKLRHLVHNDAVSRSCDMIDITGRRYNSTDIIWHIFYSRYTSNLSKFYASCALRIEVPFDLDFMFSRESLNGTCQKTFQETYLTLQTASDFQYQI